MSKPSPLLHGPEKRRAPRAPKSVDVVMLCPDQTGKSFVERTQTLDISRTGAKVRIRHDVDPGAQFKLAIPDRKKLSEATVARIGERVENLREIGICLDESGDFWGIPIDEESPSQIPPVPASEERSRALAERLLASAGVRPAGFSASGQPTNGTLEQDLVDARQQLTAFAKAVKQALQQSITQQMQQQLRQGLTIAARQLGTAAAEKSARSQQELEQRIEELTVAAQARLQAQMTALDAQISANAAEHRKDLARRFAEISRILAED